ncbi:restriction endonuclease subunit S, partial [Klebsiella pneumoniae]
MSSNYREQWTAVGGHFPFHWQFCKLEDLLENNKGIAVGVMYPGNHTTDGIPLIKVGDVKNGYIDSQPSFCISQEVDEEYKRTRLNGSELLITLVGNPGDCVVVEPHMAGWNVARALAVVRLRDISLREWLRYLLLSKPAKYLIDARLNTTVQKTLNLK